LREELQKMGVDLQLHHPLTTPQQNIWNLQKYYPNTSIANVSGMLRITSEYSYDAINRAVNLLIESNDALRLRFYEENGQPYQIVTPYQPERIIEYDMRGKSSAEVDNFLTGFAQEPFVSENATMYRFAAVNLDDKQCGIFLCAHHLICDAWSMSIVCKELIRYHLQELFDCDEPNPMLSYINAVASEHQYFASKRYEKDKAYWEAIFEEKPQLCRIKEANGILNSAAARHTKILDISFCLEMATYCNQEGISSAVLFEAALVAYLHRVNEFATPITIGIPVLNRSTAAEKKTIGMFISTTLLSVPIVETASMTELCYSIKQKHMEVFRHQKYPISHITQNIRSKDTDTSRLYDVMVSYQNARVDDTDADVSVTWYPNGHSEVPLSVHIEDLGDTGGYRLHLDYQTAVLSASETAMLCDRLLHILRQTMDNGAVKVCDIQIVAPTEYEKAIYDFNDTAIEYPEDKCIHQLFEEQTTKTPDAVAVVFENTEYTYRQINEMANAIAQTLRNKGISRGDIVAIIAKRSYKIIVAQLAILKAGGAYLPIDPSYPQKRISYMLNDAKCKAAVTLGANVGSIDAIILDGDLTVQSENLANINGSDDLCYVIYTSGSTGMPKGVMITHGNLANFCNNNNKNVYQHHMLDIGSSVLATSNLTFDISIFEIYLALLNGLQLVMPNNTQIENGDMAANLIYQHNVDVIHGTPTKIQTLRAYDKFNTALQEIKIIMVGAEVFTENMLKNLRKCTRAVIYNGYGPTEITIGASFDDVTKKENDITIGKPIANTQIYILDKNMQLLPIGVAGELCIAGDGVGRGYLNRPELTAEKFVPNPFVEGKRMYKTGDLARWREDGQLEYIGRMDNQVKIRGLRIELGEIEAAIAAFEGIKQVAVVDKKDENGRQYICAYYVSDSEIDEKALRMGLAKTLPRYMVPHFFMRAAAFPTTTSGKTDRNAFPQPDFTQSNSDVEYIAPVTDREKALVQILESVLGVSPVGMDDDFFDLGGDSLKAIELVAKAHNNGIYFALQNLFDHTTPASLLAFLESGDKKPVKYMEADFDKFDAILHRNRIDETFVLVKSDMGNLFLTGATGFLGAHILDAYLRRGTGTAYCLVRGISSKEAQKRLDDTLSYYFVDAYADNNRIVVIHGDITDTFTVDADIHTVIHSAATVKHYGSYDYFYDINVTGTKNVLMFAKQKNARMIHISTTGVSGEAFEDDYSGYVKVNDGHFYEHNLFVNQPLENVYLRSKFEAECEVLQAILEGEQANIIRVGNLTNRFSDAKFQPNYKENAFLTRMRAVLEFGVFPDYLLDLNAEFSMVDSTAESVVRIAEHFNDRFCVFHANSNKKIRFSKLFELLSAISIKMAVVNGDDFVEVLKNIATKSDMGYVYEALVNDMNEMGRLKYEGATVIENDFTAWYLNSLDFDWPEVRVEYLKRYIEYFKNIGYLEV